MMRGAWRPAVLVAALILTLVPALPPPVGAQLQDTPDDRFAGLQWRFVRIKYHYVVEGTSVQQDFYGEPWYIDAPAAEQNLSRRVRTATAIQVNDPVVLTLEDPNLFSYPWIYMVEPGNLRLKEAEVPILREFLLRGGTLTFDDFHGPIEWANLESELRSSIDEWISALAARRKYGPLVKWGKWCSSRVRFPPFADISAEPF